MAIQWPLLIFSLLAGCGGALLSSIGIAELLKIGKKTCKIASIVALILLIIGGCASVLHLGQPKNIMAAAANIFSFSGISVELIMLGINVVVAALYLILNARENASAKIVAYIGIVTGVIMAFVVGNGYVMESQPNWNTITLPLAYLGSGLGCGVALFACLMAAKQEESLDIQKFSIYVIGAEAIQLICFLAYGAALGFSAEPALFWGGAIVVGSVCALCAAIAMRKQVAASYAACACALVGGVCIRALMWIVGTGFLTFFDAAAAHSILGF